MSYPRTNIATRMANETIDESAWAQEGDEFGVDGGNGVIQNSDNTQQDINNLPSSVALHTSGDSASPAVGASEDVGEYDPESVDLTPLPQHQEAQEQAQEQEQEQEAEAEADQSQSQSQSQSSQTSLKPTPQPAATSAPVPKKRKTVGGFLVGDSDSEDDSSGPASNGAPVARPAQAPHSLLHSPHPPSTLVHEAQEAVSNVSPASQANNAPVTSVEAFADLPGNAAQQSHDAAVLPTDVITTLEERIKQEPRADMDAWLDLMAELRRRNDIDVLRAVYERFLAIFPQSVSLTSPSFRLPIPPPLFPRLMSANIS